LSARRAPVADVEVKIRVRSLDAARQDPAGGDLVEFVATVVSNFLPAEYTVRGTFPASGRVEAAHQLAAALGHLITEVVTPTLPADRGL
jgi:hypothetical protein